MLAARRISTRMAAAWLIALFAVPVPFVAVLAVFIAPVYREMMMTPITFSTRMSSAHGSRLPAIC